MPEQHRAFPSQLLQQLTGTPGFDHQAMEAVHQLAEAPVSIRVNAAKTEIERLQLPVEAPVPWAPNAYYLSSRPSFTFDPSFHAGAYYVQEASSMFLHQAITQCADVSRPLKVLDACAAPGGKTSLLQSVLSPSSLLLSNELIRSRIPALEENIVKWGGNNVLLCNNDPRELGRLQHFFDVILVDAPCSGSGLFRRDPSAAGEWSPGAVQLCFGRQQRILADVLPALRPGGLLIYSTCSYSKEENEDIADWLVSEHDLESCSISIPAEWGIVESFSEKQQAAGYRFWPYRVKGEGFYLAAFRKKGDWPGHTPKRVRTNWPLPSRKMADEVRAWINPQHNVKLWMQGETVFAVPESFAEWLPELIQNRLYIRRAGTGIGKISPSGLVPDHALAMSTLLHPQIVGIPLNREEAIQYLRKEEVIVEADPGWQLLQYNGHPLGWIKKLPNRINNYYPKEWRILKRADN